MILNAQPDLEVVGEAGDGETALRLIQHLQPDLAILEHDLPDLSGIELLAALKPLPRTTRLLILSAHEDPRTVKQLLHLGASGYLTKRATVEELLQAIHTVSRGDRYLTPHLVEILLHQEESEAPFLPSETPIPLLSAREKDVLQMIAEGLTNKEIAASLDVSIKSIETYKARGMQKLELRGRTEIVRYALQMGWLKTS